MVAVLAQCLDKCSSAAKNWADPLLGRPCTRPCFLERLLSIHPARGFVSSSAVFLFQFAHACNVRSLESTLVDEPLWWSLSALVTFVFKFAHACSVRWSESTLVDWPLGWGLSASVIFVFQFAHTLGVRCVVCGDRERLYRT